MISPQEILAQAYTPAGYQGTMLLSSGVRINIFDPKPTDIRSEDIARGIAGQFRYNSQSKPWVTTAEHSMLCADIIQILWPHSNKAKAGLAHDFCEAYTKDLISTVRNSVYVKTPDGWDMSWKQFDDMYTSVICRAYGIAPEDIHSPEVRAADILACSFERRDSQNLPMRPGLPEIPPEVDHLKLYFFTPNVAYPLLLRKMRAYGMQTITDPLVTTADLPSP